MSDIIYVPMRRKLYDDIVRCSDGCLDPAAIAEFQLESWIARDLEGGIEDHWGNRFMDMAEEYAPHLLKEIDLRRSKALGEENKPLVWKEVTVKAGSKVRMPYGGTHHYAKVQQGAIIDSGKAYTPSEWASKIAGGTSRNAWRDLWFQEPNSQTWIPAQLMREQARQEAASRSSGASGMGENDE
jgi:hypothetical protein